MVAPALYGNDAAGSISSARSDSSTVRFRQAAGERGKTEARGFIPRRSSSRRRIPSTTTTPPATSSSSPRRLRRWTCRGASPERNGRFTRRSRSAVRAPTAEGARPKLRVVRAGHHLLPDRRSRSSRRTAWPFRASSGNSAHRRRLLERHPHRRRQHDLGRQVLVIHSAPQAIEASHEHEARSSTSSLVADAGMLIRNAKRLPSFMFELGQQVDRLSRQPLRRRAGALAQKRRGCPPGAVRLGHRDGHARQATANISERIGLVESWGTPRFRFSQQVPAPAARPATKKDPA